MQLDLTWCQSNTFSLALFDYLLQMHSHDGSFNLTDGMVRVQSFHAYPRASLAALDSFFLLHANADVAFLFALYP